MGNDQSAVRSLSCHDLTADWSLPISVLIAIGRRCTVVPMHKLGNYLIGSLVSTVVNIVTDDIGFH